MFKELEIKNVFKSDLESLFASTEVYDLLGSEVFIYSNIKKEYTSFPCIQIRILNNSTATKYSTASNIESFTDFTLEIDIFSQDLEDFNSNDSVIKISELVIEKLQSKYKMSIIMNQNQPNLNTDTYRRILRMNGRYDNSENRIYQII